MDWWDVLLSPPRSRSSVTSPDVEAGQRARRILAYRQARDRERQQSQRGKDDAQDREIAALRRELDQVEVALGVLAQLLTDKGILPQGELAELIDVTIAERAGASRRQPPADA